MYFAQSGSYFAEKHRDIAAIIASHASLFIGSETAYKSLGASSPHVEWPRLPETTWAPAEVNADSSKYNIVYDASLNPEVDVDEEICPPLGLVTTRDVEGKRPSWESLGALVQVRRDTNVFIERTAVDALAGLEKFAVATIANRNGVRVVSTRSEVSRITGASPNKSPSGFAISPRSQSRQRAVGRRLHALCS